MIMKRRKNNESVMFWCYDSGWVREPNDDDDDDRYDEDNYVFNEYCVDHYMNQRRSFTITVRGAVVYTLAVIVLTVLVTIFAMDAMDIFF